MNQASNHNAERQPQGAASADRATMLSILRDRGPAGTLARFVLPLALLIPMVVGWLRFEGQRFGL